MQLAVSHACPNFHLLEGPWPCRVGLLLKVFHLSDVQDQTEAGLDRNLTAFIVKIPSCLVDGHLGAAHSLS